MEENAGCSWEAAGSWTAEPFLDPCPSMGHSREGASERTFPAWAPCSPGEGRSPRELKQQKQRPNSVFKAGTEERFML